MPTKHIDDITWKKVQEEHVKAVVLTKTSFKDTEILKLLIKKGLENIEDSDYIKLATIKNHEWKYLFNNVEYLFNVKFNN